MEECAEVQHECSKAIRFGLHDHWKKEHTNAENIVKEVIDLNAVYGMLVEYSALYKPEYDDARCAMMLKRLKVQKFMKYSRKRGRLDSIDSSSSK